MEVNTDRFNVLVCVTGSVAAIKVPQLLTIIKNQAQASGLTVTVRVCLTASALHFCRTSELKQLCDDVFVDEDEWSAWNGRGDPVLHIELTKWAHLLLIAPLDANSLAKIANGLCDNLVLCVCRAWDLTKPLLYCPAMNTKMWNHPVTEKHTTLLSEWGYTQLPPISKTLMCGDTGVGAMMEPDDIVTRVIDSLQASCKDHANS